MFKYPGALLTHIKNHKKNGDQVPKRTLQRAKKVVDFFANDKKLRKHLKKIVTGEISSKRHNIFHDVDEPCNFGHDKPISRLANMCFLPDISDTDYELYQQAKMILDETSANFRNEVLRDKYVQYVLIPEGTIFYLQSAKKMNKEEASAHYLEHIERPIKRIWPDPDPDQSDHHVPYDPNNDIPELE